MTRKAEVVPIDVRPPSPSGAARDGTSRVRRGDVERWRGSGFTTRAVTARTLPSMNSRAQNDTAAWQLIRDDLFDRIRTDDELDAVVASLSARSPTPYGDLVRRMIGTELAESDAKAFFRRVLEHRQQLSKALGRTIDVRVAALDLMTAAPGRARHDSRPILVTPSLLEKAIEEATADAVTGLPQRQHFMSLLRHELRQRRRRSVAVAFIDVDGLKLVNDRHGHARGDEVLKSLAHCARGTLRHGDVLARIGGDEFALLLVDAPEEVAEAVVLRFRERFEARTSDVGTSFSAGIALARVDETADELLARADAAMYEEKRARHARIGAHR